MSQKYIKQVNNRNFIYPNNSVAEYDVDIIHEINDNSVSGTVTNFNISGATSTGLTINFDWTWSKNSAEPYINPVNYNINLLSVHMIAPQDSYMSPWRTIANVTNAITGNTTYSGHTTINLVPSDYSPAISSFINGVYNFEIRMIGHRAIFPICTSYTVSAIPVPTPTPTPSPVPPTPTPTPSPTPVNNYTSGATINVTDTGYIKYTTSTGTTYQLISTLGNVTLSNCLICNTIAAGVPFSDVATFTIVNCGTSCSSAPPSPSPTPSPQPPLYYKLTDCQNYQTYYSQLLAYGTYNSGDRVEGSTGYYYVVSGVYYTIPTGTSGQRYVSSTGLFGCP